MQHELQRTERQFDMTVTMSLYRTVIDDSDKVSMSYMIYNRDSMYRHAM